MSSDGDATQTSVLREACIRSAIGLIFGVLVSIIIVTGSLRGWLPVKMLQTWGTDIGQRILAEPALVRNSNALKANPAFVFLDLDATACRKFLGDDTPAAACANPAKPPPALVEALISEATEASDGPAAVMLDYLLPSRQDFDDAAAFERFRAALIGVQGDLPVIAPAQLDPVPRLAAATRRDSPQFIPGWAEGRLRLAAFLTWPDPEIRDGMIRGYPAILEIRGTKAGDKPAYVPSGPFLTASITTSDKRFFEPGGQLRCGDVSKTPAENPACQKISPNYLTPAPQVFSIYSLSLPQAYRSADNARLQRLSDAYYGAGTVEGGMLYRRYALADFITDKGSVAPLFERISLRDQVLVIGTSAFEAGDWHSTSLGAMAGPEVLINATHAFVKELALDKKPKTSKGWAGFWKKLSQKLITLLITTATLFPFVLLGIWLSRLVLRPAAEATTPLGSLGQSLRAIAAFLTETGVFLLGVGAAILAVSLWTYFRLNSESGNPSLDFLLPVLAIAFEGIVEVSHLLISRLHHTCESIANHFFPRRASASEHNSHEASE